MKKKHPKVGKRVRCVAGCYEGKEGTIEFCEKCCKKYRVEWDKIGNNESLVSLKKLGCKLEYI